MKKNFKILAILLLILLIASIWYGKFLNPFKRESIKVGILYALSGTMAKSETSVVDTILMAIDEINSQGGVLGKQIQPIIVDTHSNDAITAKEVEKLITKDHVSVIFGCWTSDCRKTIKPLVEKHQSLFIFPVSYEGLEQSSHIIYTGAAPNQQVVPAIKWAFDHLGQKFFIVGSDEAFSRITNVIIRYYISFLKGEVVEEAYLPTDKVEHVVQEILKTKPTVIINTIAGEDNKEFFEALHQAGITADKIPVMSFNITENEVQDIGIKNMVGNYAAWNYFQSIDNKKNKIFVHDFKQKYGESRVTSDPMESAYLSVYLWAQAVKEAETTDIDDVINVIKQQSFDAPEGVVSVDRKTSHVWKIIRIGQIQEDGQFKIVWTSETPIQPVPYPSFLSKDKWEQLIQDIVQRPISPHSSEEELQSSENRLKNESH